MLLGGLWHGASWNFLIWGGLHGILLSIERIFDRGKKSDVRQFWKYTKIIFIFTLVSIVWIFFRAKNLESSLGYISGMISMRSGYEISNALKNQFSLIMILLILSNVIGQKFEMKIGEWLNRESGFGYYFLFSILVIGSVLLSGDLKSFIYFVF
jgi:alginate O-acetyltransferase complex protein AlgI